jgi:AraC-like DNA-binding protein
MPYHEYPPHPVLRPFVDRFWVRTGVSGATALRILPDGCIDLMIDLTRGELVAVGTMTRAVVFDAQHFVHLVAVRFRPGGATPFLRISADELTDRVVSPTELGARWLTSALVEPVADSRVALQNLERHLLLRLAAARAADPIVAHAVARLLEPLSPSVDALSRETGFTRQHLTRLFRRHVGVGPKQFARVARLQRAMMQVQRDRGAHLADAAALVGYFDQAHMSRDFQDLAGVTPLAAGESVGSIFPIRSLFAAP